MRNGPNDHLAARAHKTSELPLAAESSRKKASGPETFRPAAHLMRETGHWQAGAEPGMAMEEAP
jgi:hypothetical protein